MHVHKFVGAAGFTIFDHERGARDFRCGPAPKVFSTLRPASTGLRAKIKAFGEVAFVADSARPNSQKFSERTYLLLRCPGLGPSDPPPSPLIWNQKSARLAMVTLPEPTCAPVAQRVEQLICNSRKSICTRFHTIAHRRPC